MDVMIARLTSPEEANQSVHDFRARHAIVAVPAPADDLLGGHVCAWDGLHIYMVNGGQWRHNMAEVRVLIERAPIPEVM
jgi:hypothetical protein